MAHAAEAHDPFADWDEAEWRTLAEKQRHWLPLADACWRLSGARPGARVADVGCGPGLLAMRYAQLGGDVAAVDRHAEALARIPATPGLRAVQHDAASAPLPGAPYDVMFLTDVLHHVPAADALLRQLRASGDALVVSETGSEGHAHSGHDGAPAPRLRPAAVLASLAAAGWQAGPVLPDQPFGHYSVVAR